MNDKEEKKPFLPNSDAVRLEWDPNNWQPSPKPKKAKNPFELRYKIRKAQFEVAAEKLQKANARIAELESEVEVKTNYYEDKLQTSGKIIAELEKERDEILEEIINTTVNETVDLIDGFVNEYVDSTDDEKMRGIEEIKIELFEQFKQSRK
jgi:molecular chaperone GrpE (heat shock protein)